MKHKHPLSILLVLAASLSFAEAGLAQGTPTAQPSAMEALIKRTQEAQRKADAEASTRQQSRTPAPAEGARKQGYGEREYRQREFEFDRAEPFSSFARNHSQGSTLILTFIDAPTGRGAQGAEEIRRTLSGAFASAATFSPNRITDHFIFHVRAPDGALVWKDAFDFALQESAAARQQGFSAARPPALLVQVWDRGRLLNELLLPATHRAFTDRETLRTVSMRLLSGTFGEGLLPALPRAVGAVNEIDNVEFLQHVPAGMPLEVFGRYYSMNTLAIVTVTGNDACDRLQRLEVQFALKSLVPPDRPLAKQIVVLDVRRQNDVLLDRAGKFAMQSVRNLDEQVPAGSAIPLTGVYWNGDAAVLRSVRQVFGAKEKSDPQLSGAALRLHIVDKLEELGFRTREAAGQLSFAATKELAEMLIETHRLSAGCLGERMDAIAKQIKANEEKIAEYDRSHASVQKTLDQYRNRVKASGDLTKICHLSYQDAAVAEKHLDTFDSGKTAAWCGCVTKNLSGVLTPVELEEYRTNPAGFINRVLADATPQKPRDWRLYTPVTNCWR